MFTVIVSLWGFFLIGFLAIGGYFMFRKFLKSIPKEDGMSDLDWQNYYIEQTKHMWHQEEKDLLAELVSPVPELFRDVAKQSIAGRIGKIAIDKNEDKITKELLIEGYIIGTPKRDHRFLRKTLKEQQIDITPYEQFFELSPSDYEKGWKEKY